jgi:membrane protease YdiL (CAAX protease family)
MKRLASLGRRLVVDVWVDLDREAAAERARRHAAGLGLDWRPMLALTLAAFILIFQEYWGDRSGFEQFLGDYMMRSRWYQLGTLAWWSGAKVFGYGIVPMLTVWLAFRGRLADYGCRGRGLWKHLWIYVALYALVLPFIIAAARTQAFRETYPFYVYAGRSPLDLVLWESMYAATFLALEFFFRGFLLFTLTRVMGPHAIFVTIVPYCMIHFHKPVAEVAGAVVAGIVLGTLALATRSIWCGVLIHVSVAWTMDLLALLKVGKG